jgi:transcriptional regulator with XRE-family HTH domain
MTDIFMVPHHSVSGSLAPRTHFGASQTRVVFAGAKTNSQSSSDQMHRKIPARLRALREGKNMTQAALADYLGVSQQQIRNFESGASMMSAKHIAAACKALDASPNALFGWDHRKLTEPMLQAALREFVTNLDEDLLNATLNWWQAYLRQHQNNGKRGKP